jgi:biotin transporter BioY
MKLMFSLESLTKIVIDFALIRVNCVATPSSVEIGFRCVPCWLQMCSLLVSGVFPIGFRCSLLASVVFPTGFRCVLYWLQASSLLASSVFPTVFRCVPYWLQMCSLLASGVFHTGFRCVPYDRDVAVSCRTARS